MIKFADRKGGFPHSEICGSKGARASPHLIAACHVLHRLSTPRHPLEALIRLIVLSKTHVRNTDQDASTCALYLSDYDVFIRPTLNRVNPSFTISTLRHSQDPKGPARLETCSFHSQSLKDFSKTSIKMVEPDGLEPTTSCLQSTRSTN